MDEMEWNSLVLEVNEYLAADSELDASLRQVVELNREVGQNNESERETVKNSLKAILKGRDGTPFRRGQKSSVPAAARVAIDRVCGIVESAALDFYNADSLIASVSFKHAKSGGGLYESGEDYAAAQAKRVRNKLNTLYKENAWDGTLESLSGDSEETEEGGY